MPITLKDIAKKSGFSVTQVSRALSGYDDVSERTRKHIQAIADELGYQPNYAARQLQSSRTQTLGIVIPPPLGNENDDFFTLLLRGITYQASVDGYDVLVCTTNKNISEIDVYKRIVGGKRVDGIVVARTLRKDQRIHYLQDVDCPFIVHGRLAPDETSDFSYIDVDSQQGIALLTEHLIAQGYDKIGIILPPEQMAFTQYRFNGYRETLDKHNIAFNDTHTIHSDMTFEGGVIATETLLNQDNSLNAIIGCNDWMAHGAISVAKQKGYDIGQNFAVVGYDNIPYSLHSDPPLTTIHQPIFDIGEELIQNLVAIIDQNPTDHYQRIIQPELAIRASSGVAR